ncbi:MAG TPA: VCBS repeat-containing protein [Hellea balneolensis]|uniref:VCBS repeat-containing protein n=1 Tax=Hellea balneolensis TaxID=287478 RepID=A0A7C5M2C2_9PROT|nr:VCBS repeat-containing protein [Hellea balneolensis]
MYRVLVLLGILFATAIWSTPDAHAESFTVQRVRYCTGGGLFDNKCTNAETSPNFKQWDKYDINGSRKKMTYIAMVSEPDIEDVKHVVFISAGQQVEVAINPDGYQNVLTGQPADYKNNCLGKTKTCVRNFNPDGLAMRLKNSGAYNMSDTLFIIVLDSQYNYYLSSKPAMLDAYWEFLTSKFYPTSVKDIVLAGQSRGGCLSLLLAERLRKRAAYKHIPLVLEMNDAVCRNDGSEVPGIHPGSKTYATNPLNPNKMKSVLVDLGKMFPVSSRTNLFINNIHAGGKVGGLNIRALTYKTQNIDLGWWRQSWVKFAHTDMGGNFGHSLETIIPAYKHIMRSLYEIRYGKTLPAAMAPVDFNGDGLSDIAMFEDGVIRQGTQNRLSDLKLKVRLSNGDGTYSEHNSDILAENASLKFHPITPFLAGYFSNDRKTDLVNLTQSPQQGLYIRTYISNGDGTFLTKSYRAGDGFANAKYPALVGDVDRDGLSDILLLHRDPQRGLIVRTKFSKGDGQFRHVEHQLGDGSAVDILPIFAADVNGDNRTDLILQYQDSNGHKIRTKISNGDGTFTGHEFGTGEWLYWGHDQFLVGDVNRDRKTDLMRVFYDQNNGLSIHSFLSRGDGTFEVKRQVLGDGEPGYRFPAIIADVNNDRRDDIILRHRDANNHLIVNVKISNGDGTYSSKTSDLGTDGQLDATPALLGTFDKGRPRDLVFHTTLRDASNTVRSQDTLWTKAANSNGVLHSLGSAYKPAKISALGVDAYPAISGPLGWRGQGGTFPPCRPPVCAMGPIGTTTTPVKPVLTPIPGVRPGGTPIKQPVKKSLKFDRTTPQAKPKVQKMTKGKKKVQKLATPPK